MYSSISPFLIFHIFLVLCPLFLISLHQVSAGSPIRKGTLPVLYHIYGRYGGAGRGSGGFVKFLPSPSLPDGRPERLVFTSVCASPLRKTEVERDFPWHSVCVFAGLIAGRWGNIVELWS